MNAFIDEHREALGIEPICKVLQVAPSAYRRYAAEQRDPTQRCARARRDETLMAHIERVGNDNLQVYGADKVWQQLKRECIPVARCTVERLMRRLGLREVMRGKVVRTTVPDAKASCPPDRVNRQFKGRSSQSALGIRLHLDTVGEFKLLRVSVGQSERYVFWLEYVHQATRRRVPR